MLISLFLLYIKLTLKDTLYYAGENWELCQGLSNRTIVSIHQSMHCFHQRTSTPDSPSVLQGGTNLVRRIQNKGRIANLLGGVGDVAGKVTDGWFCVCLYILQCFLLQLPQSKLWEKYRSRLCNAKLSTLRIQQMEH